MADFLLIAGADGRGWYWHRVVPELERLGHTARPVDLPLAADANLEDYTRAAVETAAGAERSIVVGHSLGAFTAPLVCSQIPVDLLVLVDPMIPRKGESAGQWWDNTAHEQARIRAAERDGRSTEFELPTDFFHDVPDEVREQAFSAGPGAQLDGVFSQPWPLEAWPQVPTKIIQSTQDRFFPVDFQRRIARERLGIDELIEIPGGHLVALSRPLELADALHGLAA
jgi:pimeloyl-ACP methyl ester carboxylesterase